MQGINFVLEHLTEHWFDHDEAVFRKLINLAQHGIFKGSLDVIIVADAQGRVLFNTYTPAEQPQPYQSIADRDYFKQLAKHSTPNLLITPPVLNTVTQRWTVQFSYPMVVDGQFSGIILAAVSAEHLADAFKEVYPALSDVVLLALNDGHYLTRTHALEHSLGKKIPANREFIQHLNTVSGSYTIRAPIDGVERFYAWYRIPGFPVVLSLGIGKDKVMQPILQSLQASRNQNLLASVLLLLAALWITRLVVIKAQQNRSLLQTQERLTMLFNRISAGVLLEDENDVVVSVNTKLCSLLHLKVAPQRLIGLHHSQLLNLLKEAQAPWLPLSYSQLTQRQLTEVQDSTGKTLEVDWLPIQRDQRYLGHVWFVQDITSRKEKERDLITLANTDPLTGLHNRRSFLKLLSHHIELSQPQWPGALLMLDIDHFKRVNDTYGHPVGDLVIQNIAQVIRDSLRQDDVTGRLGGEEFAVLLPKATLQQAQCLAERIRERIINTPTVTPTYTIHITISIGVALLYGQTEKSVQDDADQALYQAKNTGRNRVCSAEYAWIDQADEGCG